MAVAEGMGAALGVAGTSGGFGGARIGSGFGSGFAGSHFGAALGLALFGLVLASVRRQSGRRRRAGPQSLHVRRVDSVCEIHSRSRANRQLSHGQPRAHLAVLSAVARTRTLTCSPLRRRQRLQLPKRSRERKGSHYASRNDHNRPVFSLARCLTHRGGSAVISNGELSFANSIH